MDTRQWPRRAGVVAVNRVRLGARRIRTNFSQIVQVVGGATLAYAFCHFVLGHEYPFLAAVAAAVGTGVTVDRRLRRALEFGFGATAGVLFGELMLHFFGGGIWQLATVMFVGILLGMMLNSGGLFTMQIGIQSIYVVTVPPGLSAQPFDRTTDALIGAGVALAMALLVPNDARKAPRDRAATLLQEIAEVLALCGKALRNADSNMAEDALARARDTQNLVDSWRTSMTISLESTRINARNRRYAREIRRIAESLEYSDRAMRLVRVICRRAASMADLGVDRPQVATMLDQLGQGAEGIRAAVAQGVSRASALDVLVDVARTLDPRRSDLIDLNDEAFVLLLRPLAVDLMQAGGATEDRAQDALPPLPVPLAYTDLLDLVPEEDTESAPEDADPGAEAVRPDPETQEPPRRDC